MKRIIFIALLLLSFSFTVLGDYQDEIKTLTNRMQELAGSDTGLSDSQRFSEIVGITYEYTMLSYPEFATFLGDPRGQDRWSDQSEAITLQRQQDDKLLLAALENIDREALTASEQVNYDLLYDGQKRDIEGHQFPDEMMPVNQMGGVQQDIAQMMAISQPKKRRGLHQHDRPPGKDPGSGGPDHRLDAQGYGGRYYATRCHLT